MKNSKRLLAGPYLFWAVSFIIIPLIKMCIRDRNTYRPGHADYTFDEKYGFRDYRGGGRSSGRETTARVAAGAVAAKILKELGIEVHAYTKAIGPVSVPENEYHPEEIFQNPIYMPSNAYAQKASAYLEECIKNQDSSGGIIE